jgi:hypothetical protein
MNCSKFGALLALTVAMPFFLNAQTLQTNPEVKTISHSLAADLYSGKVSEGFTIQSEGNGRSRVTSEVLDLPLQSEGPFVALGTSWIAKVGHPHQVEFSVRGSADGNQWSEWYAVEIDHHAELEENEYSGNLIFFSSDTRVFQYQVLITPNMMFTNPDLREVSLTFINPGITSSNNLQYFESTAPKSRSDDELIRSHKESQEDVIFSVSYNLPEFVQRTEWGASLGLTNTASRSTTTPTHLIVHHSAGQTNSSDFAAVVRSYWTLHTTSPRNWADIGYNWLIDRNGVLYQGRAFATSGNMNVVGAHVAGRNSFTMGVCVIGDYSNSMPTSTSLTQLRNVLAWKANERSIDVLGISTQAGEQKRNISGHQDMTATQCPGFTFYRHLPTMRERTNAYLNPPVIAETTPNIDSEKPSEVALNATIKTNRANVVAFVEYGKNSNNLESESPEIQLSGSANDSQSSFTLSSLEPATLYYYRVVAVNSDTFSVGAIQTFETAEAVSVEQNNPEVANTFVLNQNYPNPFNPSTRIQFSVSDVSTVRILIHNAQGQLMSTLVDSRLDRGEHWIQFDASDFASGVYVYSLEIDGILVSSRKMILVR